MPNAWFYYLIPLLMSVVFVCAGAALFRQFARGARDAKGNAYGPLAGCAGILCAAVGGAVGLGILFTSPTPWERDRIFRGAFHTPPERIDRFVVRPARADQYRPLTRPAVVIDDPARVRAIAAALAAGREVSANHPRTKWTARLEAVTRDGTFYFGVDATVPGDPNGTLVSASRNADGGGWSLGYVRVDGLDKLLEEAATAASEK
jgi:hypothetical protein